MCLAIPAKICSLNADNLATVDILGVTREISVDLTPQAKLDDYVLVHAGFAIEVVSEEFAQETLDIIREFPELIDTNDLSDEASAGAPTGPSLRAALTGDDPSSEAVGAPTGPSLRAALTGDDPSSEAVGAPTGPSLRAALTGE